MVGSFGSITSALSALRYQQVALDVAGTTLLARITLRSCRTLALAVGDEVFAQVKGVALVD